MRVAVLLALLALPAGAQVFPWGGGASGSGTPDPERDDVAASYQATGPNGFQAFPQAALGVCAALAGAYAAVEDGVGEALPYFCDGTDWAILWREVDGLVASSNTSGSWYALTVAAPTESKGITLSNGSELDFGAGANDWCKAQSGSVSCGSLRTADITLDDIGNRNANPVEFFSQYGTRLFPYASLPTCASLPGNLATLESDGRTYQCDGAAFHLVSRVLVVPVTYDFPSVANSACVESSVTVTGAAANDTISVNADFALPTDVSIGNARATGANTVALRLCNSNASTPQDPASGSYRFRIER
jgi:hypothetical protein